MIAELTVVVVGSSVVVNFTVVVGSSVVVNFTVVVGSLAVLVV